MVIGETTPKSGASPAPPAVLYTVRVLDTRLGVFMCEDECTSALIEDANGVLRHTPTVRRTGWQKFVSHNAYLNYWERRFNRFGDPYQRAEGEWQNVVVTWVMPFSQLSDHEGYTGDNR